MRALCVSTVALGWSLAFAGGASFAAEPAQKWEARALAALEAKDRKELQALAAEFMRLAPEVRRALPLKVYEDSVEFAFRGEFPADKTPWGMLEYLASSPEKDYESLLVVSAAELKRVQALKPVFEKRAGKGSGKWWSARLVWVEDKLPQALDLTDLLRPLKAAERERFLAELHILDAGLGGTLNVNADPAYLPKGRVPALLLLTIRIAPQE
jgi:hypothetical protein